MAVNIHCPQCRLLLQLPEQMVGRKVKCSACQAVFTAEAETPANVTSSSAGAGSRADHDDRRDDDQRDDDRRDEDDLPRRRRHYEDDDRGGEAADVDRELPSIQIGTDEREAWLNVRAGMRIHALAQFLYAGAVGAFLFLVLFAVATDGRGGGGMIFLNFLFGGVGMVALVSSLVLALIAGGFFMVAPLRHGSRPIAIALLALVTLVLYRSSGLIGEFGMLERFGGGPFMGLTIVGYFVLDVIRLTVLPLFILSVGRNMGVPALSRHALAQMIAIPAAFVFLVLVNFLLIAASRGGGAGLVLVLMLLNGAGWGGIMVWGAILLQGAAKIVAMRTRNQPG